LARVAETSSNGLFGKIKVSASIKVYNKNATLANFQNVVQNFIPNVWFFLTEINAFK